MSSISSYVAFRSFWLLEYHLRKAFSHNVDNNLENVYENVRQATQKTLKEKTKLVLVLNLFGVLKRKQCESIYDPLQQRQKVSSVAKKKKIFGSEKLFALCWSALVKASFKFLYDTWIESCKLNMPKSFFWWDYVWVRFSNCERLRWT